MKINNLNEKLKFIELIDEMKNIKRAIKLKNWRQETNAEHSYHLAMIVLIFLEDFPNLDWFKCIKLALIHDLVEIFAWDTVVLDKKREKTKKQREKEAIYELEKTLWKEIFKQIKSLIFEYEKRNTLEAEFIYQIDKFQPMIQVVMEWWSCLREYKMNIDELMDNKYKKVDDKFGFKKILDKCFKKIIEEKMFYKK